MKALRIEKLLACALMAVTLAACSDSTEKIVSGPEKTCEDFCGEGNTCSGGQCVPLQCTPACGPGTACQMGQCVAVAALSCSTTYPGCAACDTTGATPVWVGRCGSGTTCDAASDTCVGAGSLHAWLGAPGRPLHGPFANGYAATAACVSCHPQAATEVMASQHFTWAGPTPDLVAADLTTLVNPGDIGKTKLINNFCVATASNDKRCDQCHAGYGGDPDATRPQKSARRYTAADSSIPLTSRVDCLICHADPATKYAKDPKNFGNPAATVDLAAAAQSVRMPTRTNCGTCHFYAGGGDNVKLMGSSLKNPTESIDVHMGRGMECDDCHAEPGHLFRGGGVHTPTHTARAACTDCHVAAPHTGKVAIFGAQLDLHMARIACQTCHIPRFSRGQFGKMDWDWSYAGDNTTCSGAPGTCASGVITTKVNDDGTANPASADAVVTYDFIKGRFLWQRNAVPAYRWSNGKATHALTSDKADFGTQGTTADDANRITLGEPVGSATDGKIMPFKLMRGRQAFFIDGANSFAIVPNVFGPGSFWGTVQAAGFDAATYDFDGAAGPVAPGADSIAALWGKVLAVGARAAGQVPGTVTGDFARWSAAGPGTPGYDWRYTKLYMDLNHEVAPKAQALGAASGGGCTDCHSPTPKIPLCELYAGRPLPFGVTCP